MNFVRDRCHCFFILILCVLFSQPPLTKAITIEELANVCKKMESAFLDIAVEYEWSVDPPATIESMKNEGFDGLITVGSERRTWSSKLPFEERLLSKVNSTLMDVNGHSFKSMTMQSYDGKITKHLTIGALSRSTGKQADVSSGTITDRRFDTMMAVSPIRFSVLSFKYIDSEKKFLSERLRKKEFVRLDESIKKVNDFNAICAELLWDAPNVPVLHKKEPQLRVYFSIDHSYTPVKYAYMSHTEDGPKINFAVNITSLQKVSDNLWFPSGGSLGDSPANIYKATRIVVNQGLTDKDFDIKFPVGTKVTNEITGFNYVQAEVEVQSLVGKSLPDIYNLRLKLNKGEIENKKILMCFFDMEQRPSRNCITQLSKREQELKAKDIVIVAVQASKVEQSVLDEWIKDQNIPFSVGMIESDQENTRFDWGVKSLPWLILTDKKHAVTAEGFLLSELDEKIK
jgi:hypothetical protein